MVKWESAGKVWDDSADVGCDKHKILDLLAVKAIGELEQETFETRKAKHALLHGKICSELQNCCKDFIKSIEVARYAYADLLLHKRGARNLFFDKDNRHILGDMQLIQNALFWRAKILSDDKHVRYMANACRIKFPTRGLGNKDCLGRSNGEFSEILSKVARAGGGNGSLLHHGRNLPTLLARIR
ncbi:MAG: hypothetical protein C5B50_09775 [Verrucomicrobia bacterium]|nr:MAG: hypothetical protein C5B50_09775 [Verrucomicrobiota bacterium]